MPWIQHVSKKDIQDGMHFWDDKTVLIQIKDIMDEYPTPKYSFKEVIKFEFEDVEYDPDEIGMTVEHAERMISFLKKCRENEWNIVVHCRAGVCRSSAVAIVAQDFGFVLEDAYRLPNKLVMQRLFNAAGLMDSSEEIKKFYMDMFLHDF